MEFVQNLLTAATQIIALAGFSSIALHAIYKQHAKIAAIYAEVPHATPCSPKPQAEIEEVGAPVEPVTEPATELQPVIPEQLMLVIQHHEHPVTEPIAPDIWEEEIATSTPRYWVRQPQSLKPTLALMPAKEEIKAVTPTRKPATKKTPEIDLNSLDAATLRKLCTQHKVNWRNFLGKGKHMKKATMIEQLQQRLVA